jgi:4-hydroxy-3-polyprenylbenzoate decarboxylase
MAYRDLQHFIKTLEVKRLLKRIKAKVGSELEITEITDRVVKAGGPALLFENVKGSEYPVLINAFGTYERMNLALQVNSVDEIAQRISSLIDITNYEGVVNKIKFAPKLLKLSTLFPKKVLRAACHEVAEEPDLDKLPVLKCWPKDGGRFITLPLVITRDPETGIQNTGMYRLQVYDKRVTGMHWHVHKDGHEIFEKYKGKMPVAAALGCDPAVIYAAAAPVPKFIDEMLFAGFIRGAAVETVKCITNDLYVPANAEFVLEGYVDTAETREEGPFGDHTGYYSLKGRYPVFHVELITRRKRPVYPATVVGKPPMEDCFFGKATERIFLPLIRMQCPEIIDINFPIEGVFHNCVIVSIKKRYPGQAKKVMNFLWGIGQMMYTKMIVVVDETVDPHDIPDVAWRAFNNIDAKRDIVIAEGPLDALDHASPLPNYGHKLGVDATKKWPSEGCGREWPDEIEMDKDIKDLVSRRWNEYGIGKD